MQSETYIPNQYAGNDIPEILIWFFKLSSFSLTIFYTNDIEMSIYETPIPKVQNNPPMKLRVT